MDVLSDLMRKWALNGGFNGVKKNLPAIKNGERDKIEHCQIDADNCQE